jgi:hypothetical protein
MRTMTRRVLVVSHADADGHLIAEQVRRNLSLIKGFDVNVVVDPERTRDHKAWTKLNAIPEIDHADLVFFVDLMFAPESFGIEAKALVDFVQDRPKTRFFLIDHHPLPLRRLGWAKNLNVTYRPDVFDCAIGPRSGMMVVAAICEHQDAAVADIKQPIHETLAIGVRRAAAIGGPLPGDKLLALLKANRWDILLRLGEDASEHHPMPRGRRPADKPIPSTLKAADKIATELLTHGSTSATPGRTFMAYDADIGEERFAVEDEQGAHRKNEAPMSKDLEAIVTLLEVASLSLTTEPGSTFTFDQLMREVREVGGNDLKIDDRDVKIVLGKARFVKQVPGGQYRLK